jgi:hypothetical protein
VSLNSKSIQPQLGRLEAPFPTFIIKHTMETKIHISVETETGTRKHARMDTKRATKKKTKYKEGYLHPRWKPAENKRKLAKEDNTTIATVCNP